MRSPSEAPRAYIKLEALRWACEQCELNKAEIAILRELARRSDEFGCIQISNKVLGGKIGYSRSTTSQTISSLEKKGLLRRIGRRNPHTGSRCANIYHLVGWNGRTRLPHTGPPKHGKSVKEDMFTALEETFRNAHKSDTPHPDARQENINIESQITTTCLENEVLTACLRALARWADKDNTRHLSYQSHQLENWLLEGINLNKDIIPVLRSFSSRAQEVPQLRSWKYFEEAVRARHQSRIQHPQEMPRTQARQEEATISTAATVAEPNVRNAERQDAISRVLSNVVKARDSARSRGDLE